MIGWRYAEQLDLLCKHGREHAVEVVIIHPNGPDGIGVLVQPGMGCFPIERPVAAVANELAGIGLVA